MDGLMVGERRKRERSLVNRDRCALVDDLAICSNVTGVIHENLINGRSVPPVPFVSTNETVSQKEFAWLSNALIERSRDFTYRRETGTRSGSRPGFLKEARLPRYCSHLVVHRRPSRLDNHGYRLPSTVVFPVNVTFTRRTQLY